MEIPKITETVRIGGTLLVTFSDGRMATLPREEIYAKSVEVPHHEDRFAKFIPSLAHLS
jgi:hypothetical protein